MGDAVDSWSLDFAGGGATPPPEITKDPMDFLSRSWSASARQVAKALSPPTATPAAIMEDTAGEAGNDDAAILTGNPFTFACSATSQIVMDRILSQLEVSQLTTTGRLSHSSGPLNGGSLSDSPPVSPSDREDSKHCRGSIPAKAGYRGGSRTVGRWLKDRRERRKEETRAHNAQLHAAVSVAGVAAAVAAVAAATAAAASGKDDIAARTNLAVASAATLVAAQCVEAAEALGAERDHLATAVASAVSVRTPGDIATLSAAAATALRGAATMKARVLKDMWNISAVTPVEKAFPTNGHRRGLNSACEEGNSCGEIIPGENFMELCSQELVARGSELLKRTRKGALHWKIVSVYIHRTGQVKLKMKSRHIAGTITKKKKSNFLSITDESMTVVLVNVSICSSILVMVLADVVIEVCRDIPAWPGRHLLEGGEERRYFGLKTAEERVIEFECRGQREYEMWTQGISRMLTIAGDKARVAS